MSGIDVKGAKTLFEIGPIAITETILSLIVVTLLLGAAGVLLGRNLQKRPGALQVLTEKGVIIVAASNACSIEIRTRPRNNLSIIAQERGNVCRTAVETENTNSDLFHLLYSFSLTNFLWV